MKKYIVTAATLILAASLSACTGDSRNTGDTSSPSPERPSNTTPPSPTVSETTTASEVPVANSVVYEVTGDGSTAANITYMTMTGGNMGTEQATAAPLPFTKEVPLEDGGMFDVSTYSLTAQADDSGTSISCKITVNGEVKAEQTSTGPYSVVSCTGS